ncbi:MAG: hypothetical protein COU51_03300 [Parcubacteria group bacterium CG10_big_fil_rev_8_21_14_0_10_36_14]|nr:MAG: hypothetical protein COU51_03300 [Parcubacteria group bacterium CG10_big_fil_rev_8_21_14_0_10_36_14]
MNKLLQELKIFLDFLPEGFADKPNIDFAKEVLTEDDARQIVEFGKKSFPYVYAYSKVFDDCCRIKEEAGIHNFIEDESVRKRFDKFLRDGGEVEQIKQGKVHEEYLSREDVLAFQNAEREVHKEVHREVAERIAGQDKEKFGEYVEEGKKKVLLIEEKIANLRQMAGELPEHSSEINQKIMELEERWVNYSNEPQIQDLDELLEFYGAVATAEY